MLYSKILLFYFMSESPSREEVLKARFAIEYIKNPLLERFLRYVKVHTTSDENAPEGKKPSTDIQLNLAKLLFKELQELGVPASNVSLDEHGCVLAKIPATPGYENCPSIIFNSHMDTSCACSGENVKPQIHENYDGKPLNIGNGIIIDQENSPSIKSAIGDTVITSDGSTLLGADDKCGVSEIMTLVDVLLNHQKDINHGPIEVMFNCDEEIGNGTLYFPKDKVDSKIGFTIDGDVEGSLEYENFNAYTYIANFIGRSCHTGSARGKFANAAVMASTFVSMLPRSESPEATDGRYGFYCPISIKGEHESAKVVLILRDFDMNGLKRRIATCDAIAKAVEAMFPGGKVETIAKLGYLNMYDKLKDHPEVIDNVKLAFNRVNVKTFVNPIRGGTDGSTMTSKYDIMTPNLYTGSDGFHSRYEWAALGQMISMVQVMIEIVKIYAEKK